MKTIEQVLKTLKNKFKKLTCWHQSLLFLAVFLLISIINRKLTSKKEGFIQKEKYIEKHNIDIYDKFYVALYDSLYKSDAKNNFELGVLINNTKLNKKSKILDIGSGTGDIVGYLSKKGYDIQGIDKSLAMVEKSKEKYPNANFHVKDALISMSFPSNTFTHINCLFFTIYYVDNKLAFFTNCFNWLKPGGYLTVHMVNREEFDPIIPAADPLLFVSPQKYAKERITNSYVKFEDCEYKSDFNLKKDENIGMFTEKIKNDNDGHVRQNIHKLFMPTQKNILKFAKDAGFIMLSKTHMDTCQYHNQYLYIFNKPE